MPKLLVLVVALAFASIGRSTAAQDIQTAQAVASRDAAGVTVRYTLPEPVTRVAFSDHDTIRTLWAVTTPGLTLDDDVISSERPFDAFELHLRPDAAEVDRVYMGLSLAGEGRVVFGPGFMLEGIRTELSFALTMGETSLPDAHLIDGYAYVGPSTDIAIDPRGDVVTGTNIAPELSEALRHSFFDSMAFYAARLNAGLPFRPVLIGSVDSPGPASFRGDVTETGVISVRFQGNAWRDAIEAVDPFVWHETFHLWNSHSVETPDAEDAPWLHEGGAEYAAVVGAVSTGAMDEASARSSIARRLNGCHRLLGADDLDPVRLQSGNGPYDCGVLIQWLVDLEARKAGSGDVFMLWKTMLAAARTSPTGYGVSEFRALTGTGSAVAVLLDGPSATRWATIKARLADLDVTIENHPGDQDLRGAALMHVARINCPGGSYGFYDTPGELTLDGANCGVLSGEPIIDTVEGHDPHRASRPMFEAIQARCADNLPIRYGTRDGRVLEASCNQPLVEPEVWTIVDAPPLAIKDESRSTVTK
ncbi:hypothetical protein [Brevundimonas subvibrioides]|uniref:hypothetical protein n=1 Tax=Brevundimonas subvibrioides TaxID=74313 RepID=UPI0022B4CA4E|nr:hypothetical protein [Brevundimonas subvibrioides]